MHNFISGPRRIFYGDVADMQKFAESIVRECIEIVDKVYDEQTGKGGKLCSRDTPYQEIINEIEDHFGVE